MIYSGLPRKCLRSSGFWVQMPMGQVSRLQTRIMTQPMVISREVPKPNSSAPSIQLMATSRPESSLESLSMRTRVRRPFRIKGLVGLGDAKLPGQTGIFDGVAGCCARAAVIAGDEDDLCAALGHTGSDGADTGLSSPA